MIEFVWEISVPNRETPVKNRNTQKTWDKIASESQSIFFR